MESFHFILPQDESKLITKNLVLVLLCTALSYTMENVLPLSMRAHYVSRFDSGCDVTCHLMHTHFSKNFQSFANDTHIFKSLHLVSAFLNIRFVIKACFYCVWYMPSNQSITKLNIMNNVKQ